MPGDIIYGWCVKVSSGCSSASVEGRQSAPINTTTVTLVHKEEAQAKYMK